MKKRFLFIFLSLLFIIMLISGCFPPGKETGQWQTLEISFGTAETRGTRAAAGEIANILISIEDNNSYRIFDKKRFKVYPMGQQYVTDTISFTGRDGDYTVTEFLVLDNEDRVVYASPIAGSEKAGLVRKPLPYTFKVLQGTTYALPLEVVEVDTTVTPGELGYINLGFTFAEASVDSGLITEYMFYGNGGDTSGHNNNAILNGVGFTDDRAGNPANACSLADSSQYIETTAPITDSEISISLWYYYNNSDGDSIALASDAALENHHILIMQNTGEIGLFKNGWTSSGYILEEDNWYHVAGIFAEAVVKLYINGKKVMDHNQGFNNPATPLSLFGNIINPTGTGGAGIIDDIKIYSRTISGREVEMLYTDTAPAVKITYPENGSTVSGTIRIEADAEDDNSVARVEFYLDNALLGVVFSPPYTYTWNTETAINMPHTISATAYDSLGNVKIDNDTTVSVNNSLEKTKRYIASGTNFSAAVKADGTVWTWGRNNEYQLGDGSNTQRNNPVMVNGLTNIVSIDSGSHFSLALRNDGTVWAWGSNDFGQLGDGTTLDKAVPVKVTGLTNVVAVACGSNHSLALKEDGTLWGFGDNNNGELGLGDTSHRYTPVRIEGLYNITAIAGGSSYTLALKDDGSVWSSGYNNYGQLGNGTTTQGTSFDRVQGINNIISIACGNSYALALVNDGTVMAWGYNGYGNLGDGSATARHNPVKVRSLSGIIAVTAGNQHSLALKEDGTAWAWGYNQYGELGDGTGITKHSPVKIETLTEIVSIETGFNQNTLALDSAGNVMSWGYNGYGQLGTGNTTNSSIPVMVSGIAGVAVPEITFIPETPHTTTGHKETIATGTFHSLTIRSDDGSVWSWGYNGNGQLGDASTTQKLTPVEANGIPVITSIDAGSQHTIALREDGAVLAWGYNNYGQLGDGTTTNRLTYIRIEDLSGIVAVAAGGGYNGSHGYVAHSLALKNDGTVLAWGYNAYGGLGDCSSSHRNTPVSVNGLTHVDKIAAGYMFSMALKDDGTVWAWGSNSHGQLGDGTSINKYAPFRIEALSDIVDISAGGLHAMALKADGTVYSWGYNGYGQIGNASTTNSLTPVLVNGLTGVIKIDSGFDHSLAIRNDNTLWAWGYNGYGNLGDGTTITKLSPALITAITDVADVTGNCGYNNSSIYSHTLAITTDGTLWAWGYNGNGELGDGTTTNSYIPVGVEIPWY